MSDHDGLWVSHGRSYRCITWLGYLQWRESNIKVKIEWYTSVPNEQAHHCHCQTLDHLITDNKLDTIYAPLHVDGSHWTLLQIDLQTQQYAYGDSLHPSTQAPPELIDFLNWWLKSLAPGLNLILSSHRLIMPQQEDSFSCGVVILSTLACKLVDECGP